MSSPFNLDPNNCIQDQSSSTSNVNMIPSRNASPNENGKRLRRDRSDESAVHYENGHHNKKGPGASKSKKDEPRIFVQSKFLAIVYFICEGMNQSRVMPNLTLQNCLHYLVLHRDL